MRALPFGSPGAQPSAASLAMAATWSISLFGAIIRVGATQDWPEFIITEATEPPMAGPRSASSSTMFGDLPPSSWCTRFRVGAAVLATSMPARVER